MMYNQNSNNIQCLKFDDKEKQATLTQKYARIYSHTYTHRHTKQMNKSRKLLKC